jgi:hypothetical protein
MAGVPYTFSTASQSIPLAQLDSNFATPITLGSTTAQLGQTVTSINNLTLSNVTILSGSATLNNLTGNVTFGNTTVDLGNSSSSIGNLTLTNTNITSGNSTVFNMTYTGALTGGTGVVNYGSGQFYKATNGYIGLGTTNPSSPLEIVCSANIGLRVGNGTYSGDFVPSSAGGMAITTNGAYPLLTYVNSAFRTGVNSQGQFTVGNSGSAIVSSSDVYVQSINNSQVGQYVAGQTSNFWWSFGRDNVATGYFVFAWLGTTVASINNNTGVYTAISDRRLKKNITSIKYGLKEVLALNPVMYNMKTEDDTKKKHIGLIAQEVKVVMDELVEDIDETKQSYGLANSELVPVLIKAIQELSDKFTTLENKVMAL